MTAGHTRRRNPLPLKKTAFENSTQPSAAWNLPSHAAPIFFCRAPLSIRSKYATMSLTTSWTEGDAVREWRQGVRKLLLLLYTVSLLASLGCFLWNASVPVRVHSAPKCYPSKGDGFTPAPVPTLPADSILNTGDAAALDALPGIGPVLSERIITYREEHGAFGRFAAHQTPSC